jgi:hypothetical protein
VLLPPAAASRSRVEEEGKEEIPYFQEDGCIATSVKTKSFKK